MEEHAFAKRVAMITDALRKASLRDLSIGIGATEDDDALDLLVTEIDGFLARCRESMAAYQKAHEARWRLSLRPQEKGRKTLSPEHSLILNALEKNSFDTIYFKDLQSRFIFTSHPHDWALSLEDGRDVIGLTDFDLFTEEHAREAFEDEQRIIRTGEPIVNKEEKQTWPDRPPTWVLTTKMPLRDRDGTIVGTFGISHDITDRHQSDEALRKSEERSRLLFNSINDAVFVYGITEENRPARITEVNDIACQRLGYTREELLRMTPLDLDPPEDSSQSDDLMACLKADRHAMRAGFQVTKEGRKIPVEISAHLFEMDGQGTVLATVRDITMRKQLEENLEKERTLLATLINNLPDYVSVKDTEGRILITNAANAYVMGLASAQEAVGKTDLDFYPYAEASAYLADERTIVESGTSVVNKEEESFDRQGHRRWTLTTKIPLHDAHGKVTGVVCTGRDITERRQAEKRIEDLARFPDENPNPIIRVSLNGAILYANPYCRSLLPSFSTGHAGRIPPERTAELAKAWESSEKRVVEVREGGRIFEFTVAPIRSGGYINLYGRDVTEERSLSEKFLQAQKMEAIGRLAGGIAHDFNNLLTVIGGYSSLLQEEIPAGTPTREQIDEIDRATRQAISLTGQLLAFSRKQVLKPSVIDVNALIRAEEKIVRRLVGEDIELNTKLPADVGEIKSDPGQMQQLLMNLVVNARDAMPQGGQLTIETSNQLLDAASVGEHAGVPPGQYVRIRVSDTGHGMDREVFSHIFEPFFTTKERGKGTGLGLSTVYGIVKQSNGHITCTTEPGVGTTFAAYFPRTFEVEEGTKTAAPLAAAHGGETVLLVEDEETVRRFARIVLERNGYTVVDVAGGEGALSAMDARPCAFDLVVTDVVMPRMSGKELAERISLSCPGIKILFMSGYTGDAMAHHGLLDPGIQFISKPFTSHEFLAKVRHVLDEGAHERASEKGS